MKKVVRGPAPPTLLPLLTNVSQISDRPGHAWYHQLTFFPVHLVIENPDTLLLRFADSCEFLGTEDIHDMKADHLRFHRRSSHWDLWIASSPPHVPIHMVRTDWQPNSTFEFRDWKINGPIENAEFALFEAPADFGQHDITLIESFRQLIGKQAPDFRLERIDGSQVSRDDYKGKIVLLDFWATWCAPCRKELSILGSLSADYVDQIDILAVTSEDSRPVSEFLEDHELSVVVALDADAKCANAYGVSPIPHLSIIDQHGILRHTFVGLESNLNAKLKTIIDEMLGSR